MIGSRKPRLLAAVTVLSAMLGAGKAFAQEPPVTTPPPPPPVGGSLGVFGERGQFVVSSDLNLSLLRTSYSMGGGSFTSFNLTPSLDYFVSSNFSVGGLVGFDYVGGDGGSRSTFALGARAGYNVFLSNVVTLWVRGGLVYAHASNDPDMGTSTGANAVQLQIFAPVLWHPAPHFFIGAGPAFRADLMSTVEGMDASKETSFGILSTVGGYWGGL